MTIPSDTVCYPAKLMHGHVINLLDKGVKTIFYPCMSYNIDEGRSDNHYNCPVVAYYPEVIKVNVKRLKMMMQHLSTSMLVFIDIKILQRRFIQN